ITRPSRRCPPPASNEKNESARFAALGEMPSSTTNEASALPTSHSALRSRCQRKRATKASSRPRQPTATPKMRNSTMATAAGLAAFAPARQPAQGRSGGSQISERAQRLDDRGARLLPVRWRDRKLLQGCVKRSRVRQLGKRALLLRVGVQIEQQAAILLL